MERKRSIILALIICLYFPIFSFAETIVLKSGKTVEGKIIERTNEYVRVEINGIGIPLTYFLYDIVSIEGVKPALVTKGTDVISWGSPQTEVGFQGQEINPKLFEEYNTKVENSIEAENWEEANLYLDKLIAMNPYYNMAYLQRAHVYLKKGLIDKAESDWKKFTELSPAYAKKIGGSVYDLRDYMVTEELNKKRAKGNLIKDTRSPEEIYKENINFWKIRINNSMITEQEKDQLSALLLELFPYDRPIQEDLSLGTYVGETLYSAA